MVKERFVLPCALQGPERVGREKAGLPAPSVARCKLITLANRLMTDKIGTLAAADRHRTLRRPEGIGCNENAPRAGRPLRAPANRVPDKYDELAIGADGLLTARYIKSSDRWRSRSFLPIMDVYGPCAFLNRAITNRVRRQITVSAPNTTNRPSALRAGVLPSPMDAVSPVCRS